MKTSDIFYAKILLFGEYSIIKNSMALTIPYKHFTGELSFISDEKYTDWEFAINSNTELKKFFKYVESLQIETSCKLRLDLDTFRNDLGSGLYFESNIPQGYGIGSSGALCAAIYDKYGINKIAASEAASNEDILMLKSIFSKLEAYFHGTSSGIDPLNSYFSHPLLITGKEKVEMVGIPRNTNNSNGAIFVLNSGIVGHTEPLVRYFLEKYNNEEFRDMVDNQLIPLTNQCIGSILNGELDYGSLRKLSLLQMNHFERMIPDDFKELWRDGISSGDYYLKLCGSGGGGFILGFTRNYDEVKSHFQNKGLEVITVSRNRDSMKFN